MADGSNSDKDKRKRPLRQWVESTSNLPREADHRPDVAVALGYDIDVDNAPKVVAKGEGVVAEKIIEIALANGIKVRRDADLATVLSALEIDAEIPYEAFTAVAEILSYVYQANDRIRRQTAGKKGNGETA